jgi:hypothetical protein
MSIRVTFFVTILVASSLCPSDYLIFLELFTATIAPDCSGIGPFLVPELDRVAIYRNPLRPL